MSLSIKNYLFELEKMELFEIDQSISIMFFFLNQKLIFKILLK